MLVLSLQWECILYVCIVVRAEEGPMKCFDMPIVFTPNPFLASRMDVIEKGLGIGGHSNKRAACCDIGCGSGRDSIWICKRGEEL